MLSHRSLLFVGALTLASTPAWAVVTLGKSSQNLTLTGIGPNAQGYGQANMGWGSCPFDGTTTTCTLSGPYTGLGKGGTYSFVVSYAGNGTFPLYALFVNPSNNLFSSQATGPLNFSITLAETGGATNVFYSFANFNFQFSNPVCTGIPAPCNPGPVSLTPGATLTAPIVGQFDPAPRISPNGALSALSYGGFPQIAPATWIEIYGVNLAVNTLSYTWGGGDFNGNQAPTTLAGTTVTVGGKPAYVDYISPGQVNAQVPSGLTPGTQDIVVTTVGGSSIAFSITVNAVEPGLLAPVPFIINGTQHVVALLANTFTYILPVNVAGVSSVKARPGDNLTMYGIGFGSVTPDIPAGQIVQQTSNLVNAFKISFAGVPAQVTYQGLTPGFVGLYQFNVVVPNVPANDNTALTYTLNGATNSQPLAIAIRN